MAACATVVLMAFVERKDMRYDILGLTGRNLWNILLINTTWAWLVFRKKQGLTWDFPPTLKTAFFLYLLVILGAFLRLIISPTNYLTASYFALTSDYLVNPLKFLLPALMLFDGCRSRKELTCALGAVLLTYFFLAVLTIKYMGLSNFSGSELSDRAARVISRDTGYHRVDMSMMLAGASWGIVAFSTLVRQHWLRVSLWGLAGIVLLGQMLTAGRAGYLSWAIVGLILAVARWRTLLFLMPVAVLLVFAFVPGVRERMFEGFGEREGGVVRQTDQEEVTAGRSNAWPLVIEKIKESPVIGYGRAGMMRTGLAHRMEAQFGDRFNHPHNAYLEQLLDNGLLGFLCVIPLFVALLIRCLILFRDPSDILVSAAGGVGLALILALMTAALGSQTFYPRQGLVGMWAALALALRVFVEKSSHPDSALIFESEPPDPLAEDAFRPVPSWSGAARPI
jgi:O-antigen ligase